MPGASQPLAYGSILSGALLLIAGVTGSTIPSVAKGQPDRSKAFAPGEWSGGAPGAPGAPSGAPVGPAGEAVSGPSGGHQASGPRVRDQATFGAALSKFTGLDKGVVAKWLLAEQPAGQAATPGSNNWLNLETGLGPGSGPGSASDRSVARLDPVNAAHVTAVWLARNQPSILRSAHLSPAMQEAAIVHSGFAESHYGGHL